MEIRINSLAHINEAAKQFVAAMGDNTIFAFYGHMGAGKMAGSDARASVGYADIRHPVGGEDG